LVCTEQREEDTPEQLNTENSLGHGQDQQNISPHSYVISWEQKSVHHFGIQFKIKSKSELLATGVTETDPQTNDK
jgi:hypothetical protein